MSPRDGALNAHIELPFKTAAKIRKKFLFVCFYIHSLSTTFFIFLEPSPVFSRTATSDGNSSRCQKKKKKSYIFSPILRFQQIHDTNLQFHHIPKVLC